VAPTFIPDASEAIEVQHDGEASNEDQSVPLLEEKYNPIEELAAIQYLPSKEDTIAVHEVTGLLVIV
jgi:hypothetical protein